jgi:KAP family P-loop domain
MPTDPRWERLTRPAQAAWRWAWTVATARTGAAEPSGVLVDTLDLFAGLALAHLRDSPVTQLCKHFHIPLGVVLSDGGTRRYDATALLAAARRVPDGGAPQINDQASEVLDHALSAMPPSSDELVTLSMLFGALLETTNLASTALRTELVNHGVDPDPVMRSCRGHLATRMSYEEYLRENHPYRPPEIQLPPYAPDEPRRRHPAKQTTAEPSDLVGISAEVDAFAYLIASRTLTPPLAIGLFGAWGSGKSYFMRSLQRRIDQLVTAEVKRPPFHRAIAQIEFNAWQYVEGNLWASLLEHLFRNLRRAGEQDADDLLETRRREYLTKITEQTVEHQRAAQKRDELAGERQRVQQVVHDKTNERDRELAELERKRQQNPFIGWRPSPELYGTLDEVKKKTGTGDLGTQADELRQTLALTSETLRRTGPILAALRTGGWRYAAALIAVIAIGPLISFLLSWLHASAVSNVIGSLSALLAGITAYAARGNTMIAGALEAISAAQVQLDAELDARREQFDQEIRDAQIALANTERALNSAIAEERQLAASVAELETELAKITPSSVLTEFLGQRSTSDDYRRHLGIPALVRQDLERLSRLIQQQQETDGTDRPVIDDSHRIDRVVLYIDDLDRCPTHAVIKVLEAVHLLLAFPLFVVVVAVDARWLESSLREHYTQLDVHAAAPADYLEKIFQVPFWVRPLGAHIRRQMMRGLLLGNLASTKTAIGDSDASIAPIDVSDADSSHFTRLVESFAETTSVEPSWLEAAKLTVTSTELSFLEEISPLIGPTPRAAKRFVNIYLLLKSVGRGRGWPMPDQGQVAVLLAIATGLPDLADTMLPHLGTSAPKPQTLRTILAARTDDEPDQQLAQLNAWLTQHPQWHDVPLSGIDRWIELILRFRFNRGSARAGGP